MEGSFIGLAGFRYSTVASNRRHLIRPLCEKSMGNSREEAAELLDTVGFEK